MRKYKFKMYCGKKLYKRKNPIILKLYYEIFVIILYYEKKNMLFSIF